jgi:ethanolamine utilization protein EutP (predicted NTPase)
LEPLETFFSTLPIHPVDGVPEVLRPLVELHSRLRRPERRVTFLGAVKTGKSSLLNGLLGATVLPALSYRSLATVTEIEYGLQPAATLVDQTGEIKEIPFDALRAFAHDVDQAGSVKELRLKVPLPLLANHAVLVDTPGLLESDAMDQAAYAELFRTDLAVVVLAGDKILSAEERAAAAEANDLLQGNVVFVVNRLDLVDEEDRDDVVEWARSALRETGNALVGRARVFATAAAQPPESISPRLDVRQLEVWLAGFLASDVSSQVALVSRLGILEYRLREAAVRIRHEREQAERHEADERSRHVEQVTSDRAAMHKATAEGRLRMQAVQRGLPAHGEAFVTQCTANVRAHLDDEHPESSMHAQFRVVVEQYAQTIHDDVAAALSEVPVTPPPFDLGSWIVRMPIDRVTDPAKQIGLTVGDALTSIIDGGRAGREAGAAIGGWIGKNVLGIDAEGETLKRIEAVARGVLAPIQTQVEAYLARILDLLEEADAFSQSWASTSRDLEDAESQTQYWSEVLLWCDGFLATVQALQNEVSIKPQE